MSGHHLAGRSFVKELDFTPKEWLALLDLAAVLKADKRDGGEQATRRAGDRPDLREVIHPHAVCV